MSFEIDPETGLCEPTFEDFCRPSPERKKYFAKNKLSGILARAERHFHRRIQKNCYNAGINPNICAHWPSEIIWPYLNGGQI